MDPNPPPPSSLDSAAESWAPPPASDPVPGGGKVRLMCSYGGHIVPRPHDKSLCYVGGDTRMVVVDRGSTLSDLCERLSKTLVDGRPFTLKYQLPSEDLDSLISLTTDDDLDNLFDEYDRASSRLRLFLFFETAASSAGALQSGTWFVDALNGLQSLPDFNKHVAGKNESLHYAFSAPDPPLVENNNSSFGSSSSSPSHLPPIRVRVADDQRPGSSVEEQFAQMSFNAVVPQAGNPVAAVVSGDDASGAGAKVFSDEERSEHGAAPFGFRKPPLQPKGGGAGYGLPSPDSVASDTSSIASASSLSKPMYYQDQHHHHHHHNPPLRETRGPASPNTTNEAAPDPVPVPGTHHPQIHQQYVQAGTQYVHQPNPVPMQPYYQLYPQTTQQFHHHPIDQQYPQPLYVMSYATANPAVPTSRPGPASGGIPPVYSAMAPTPAQLQQHYMGYSQISHHHPSQSVTVASSSSSLGAPNYAFEYANPASQHEQVFYAAPMPSQYQSMTPAAAIALSEAAKQLPSDNINAQQQIR